MIISLIISLVVFIFVSLFGYLAHKALHKPWTKMLGESHMTHHLKLYPITDYMSDIYRSAGKHNTIFFFAVASVPVLALPILLWFIGLISLFTMIFIIIEMLAIGWLHNYIHDAFHINNHLLTKIPVVKNWFAKLAKVHFIHHEDMNFNYGIFFMTWDKLFKTYKE